MLFRSAFTESNAVSVNITTGTYTLAETASNVYKNLNYTGFSGTIGNSVRTVYGNFTMSTTATLTAGTNATTFGATSGTQQVTTNGVTLDYPITQNGVGGTVRLQDNLTLGITRTFTLTNGSLDVNGKTLSTGIF